MARMSWEQLARLLGERMVNHQYCEDHPTLRDADPDCPYCRDRDAYLQYVAKVGARPDRLEGYTSVPVHEVPRTE